MTTPEARKLRIGKIIAELRAADATEMHVYPPDLADEDDDEFDALTIVLNSVADQVGTDFLELVPAPLLESFCSMTIIKNQDTGFLLRTLIESFMRAYSNDQTTAEALRALFILDHLGGKPESAMN